MHLGPALPSNALGSAQWLPDDAAKNCMRCGEEFTAFTRRHHCRQCGQIFCHRCCNSKALLQPGSGTAPEDRVAAHPVFGAGETDKRKPQKVCGKCFELLLPMQPFLTATNDFNFLVFIPPSQQLTSYSPPSNIWVIIFYFC